MFLELPDIEYRPYVLAVDDEPINRLILEDLIEEHYQLKVVDSGASCFEAIKEKEPDLILLDINMPHMSGYEVCSTLKENEDTKHIPIIFLTAKAISPATNARP